MDTKSGILVPFYLFYCIFRNDITQSDIISSHTYPNTSTQCFASFVSSMSLLLWLQLSELKSIRRSALLHKYHHTLCRLSSSHQTQKFCWAHNLLSHRHWRFVLLRHLTPMRRVPPRNSSLRCGCCYPTLPCSTRCLLVLLCSFFISFVWLVCGSKIAVVLVQLHSKII